MTSAEMRRKLRGTPLWVPIALVIVVALAVGALSFAAVTGAFSREPEGFPAAPGAPSEVLLFETENPVPTTEGVPDGEPETPEPTPEAEPLSLAVPTRVMVNVEGDILARATVGTCESPGQLEFTSDGGETWAASETLADAGATKILRILPTRTTLVQIVALSQDCVPQLYRTENLGGTWLEPVSAVGAWFLDPSSPDEIGGPDGMLSTSCEGLSLAAIEDRAALLCSDSTAIMSSDRGFTWGAPVDVPDALAMNTADEGYVAVVAGGESCEGLRTASIVDDTLTYHEGCLELDFVADPVGPGDIAVTQAGEDVVLWAGERVVRSPDRGVTWG